MKTLRYVFLAVVLVGLAGGVGYAQNNITNTLGTGGVFTIKDGTYNYFSLSQSSGNATVYRNLELGNQLYSGSTIGVITKSGIRFIHNYFVAGTYGSNTFVGLYSGSFAMSATTEDQASRNTAVGNSSLSSLTTGSGNSALGSGALTSNDEGGSNTAIGFATLSMNTSGIRNTALGYRAGDIVTTGENLTLIGYYAQPSGATATNEITLGNADVSQLRCKVTTITALSDARDKKNIRDLNIGLDFLMKVKPRLFNWDRRDWYKDGLVDGSKMEQTPSAGFIAQELDEVQIDEQAEWLKLVLKSNPEKLEATPGNLLPVVVKAVQELKKQKDEEIAELKKENEDLKVRVLAQQQEIENFKELKAKVAALEQTIAQPSLVQGVGMIEERDTNKK